MQVTVETTQGLERRIKAVVPAEKVNSAVQARLKSMAPRVKMDGFRPGKVPMRVVEQRYGAQARYEAINDLVSETFYQAVSEKQLRLAGAPEINPGELNNGTDIHFEATFEVYPEIQVGGVDGVVIERPVASVTEADVDKMIDKLREQRRTWSEVSRASKSGDQVTVDFKATIDGEGFAGGEGTGMTVVLGAGRMIEGFEDKLTGVKAGAKVEADLPFPEVYHNQEIAGKTAHFVMDVVKVEEPVLPEANDQFAVAFGITDGGIEKLRKDVRDNMQRELDFALKNKVKNLVMDALLEKNSFDIPKVMVNAEAKRLAEQMRQQMAQRFGGRTPEGMEFKPELFLQQGERRVALGLLLSEIIQQKSLKANSEAVLKEIRNIASAYEDPSEVEQWYRGNRERMSEIESMVLEDQVVQWVLQNAKVTEKSTTFDEVVNNTQ
ncbi:MAG: trigger factor [Gammaproteobacteria bacterium]|nr:trigger factor [Gammaproteobacteria bacterium]